MPHRVIKRHSSASTAARAFLEALFSNPGTELSWADIQRRRVAADIPSSDAIVSREAKVMIAAGFLSQPHRGFYARSTPSSPLPLHDAPDPAPSDDLPAAGVAEILARLDALQASFDALAARMAAPVE